ncbi:MAG: hypothetical protein AMJ78_04960 [Omnitrophica WOR_2 bacterium SM23_29]|nr:MAG: hypothetical protein AMJ78_04960 [Omnitrophica WOR_2 bacterium SM23_29]
MTHYQMRGKGKVLLFIHGWGWDSRVWVKQLQELSKNFCAITMDLRGHGRSEWKSADNLLDAFAEDVLILSKKLNLKNINFIGWSLGCNVIFRLFEIEPAIFSSVTLVGGTPKFLKGDGFDFGFEKKNTRLLKRRLNRDFNSALLDFRRSIFLENEVKKTDFPNLWKILNEGPRPNRDALNLGLEILERNDFREGIRGFYVPVLIVCGEGDPITPKGASVYMNKAIKDSALVMIKGAGHAPFLTKPYEFNQIFKKWINEK